MLAGTTSTPEKDLRLSHLHSLLRAANRQNAQLQARLKEKAATYGETSAKSAPSMRWHPLMIKWCLHMRHISSGGYEALWKSGCLSLPSQHTLHDYTHYASVKSGFSMAVDYQLIDAAQIGTCEERKKCVALLMDEIYVKQDLVYHKIIQIQDIYTDYYLQVL